jgi:excisionase family DNA binding protein
LSTNSASGSRDLPEWISQAEAARLRGVTRQAIANLIRKGRLRTLPVGGYVLVSRDDVLNFEPQPAGRPRNEGVQ